MNNNNYNNNNEREDKMNLVNEGVLPPDEMDDRDERREEQERARSRETVADIVADIRERAENAMRNGERLVHNEAVAMLLRSVADRLEAAWKRDEEHAVEHATRHAEAVARDNCRDCVHNPNGKNYKGGNEAAMREAAVSVYYSLEKLRPFSLHLDDVGRMREFNHLICLAKNRLDAALSAPARNCDVGTPETMREACQKTRDLLVRRGNGKCQCVLTWDEFNDAQKMLRAALSAPARNCDLYATYAEAAEAHKEYATAYIARSSNKFDFPMEFDEWLFAPAAERKGDGDESK